MSPNRSAEGFDCAALRAARHNAGSTQRQVAEVCGVTLTYLAALERGRKKPSPQLLFRLAEAVGVAPSSLLHVAEAHTLTQLRSCVGLSQKEVAERVGLTDMSYSRFERGVHRLPEALVDELARVFGVTPVTVRTAADSATRAALARAEA